MQKEETTNEAAAKSAVGDWCGSYLSHVCGRESAAALSEASPADVADHILSVFAYLDIAPLDGIVTSVEIDRAINYPPLHFNGADIAVLHLMKAYFAQLRVLGAESTQGITREDVSVLKKCLALQNHYRKL